MTQAWWAGRIASLAKPPALKDILVDVDTPRVKSWQEIKAALMFAMPPKTTVQ